MKRYFKRIAEAELGFGDYLAYLEFDDEWATRQIELHNGSWSYASVDDNPESVTDQPLSAMEMKIGNEISKEEFEDLWEKISKRSL